jgi:hypothetical protein
MAIAGGPTATIRLSDGGWALRSLDLVLHEDGYCDLALDRYARRSHPPPRPRMRFRRRLEHAFQQLLGLLRAAVSSSRHRVPPRTKKEQKNETVGQITPILTLIRRIEA